MAPNLFSSFLRAIHLFASHCFPYRHYFAGEDGETPIRRTRGRIKKKNAALDVYKVAHKYLSRFQTLLSLLFITKPFSFGARFSYVRPAVMQF
jgi:hypothetical protein